MPHEVNANKLARTINILGDAKRGLDAHPPLGEDALKAFKAVVFLESTKAGAGIGIEVGSGYMIKILEGGKLSAPVPMKESRLGFTIHMGFQELHSAILLSSDEDIAKFLKGDVHLGTDLVLEQYNKVSIGSEVGTLHKPQVISVTDDLAYADVFLSGGHIGVCSSKLKNLYGDKTAEEVLSGSVPVPEPFTTVYAHIAKRFMA